MTAERIAAFVRNDLEYAPFGASFLRGLTPARFGIAALMALSLAIVEATDGVDPPSVVRIWRIWSRVFVAAMPLILLVVWVDRRTLQSSWKARLAGFALATVAGAAAFAAIRTGLQVLLFRVNWLVWPTYPFIPVHFYRSGLVGGFLAAVLFFAGRERDASRRMHAARLARVAAERQIAEARLQLLRAQIEPHFLFNSFASVKRLYEQDSVGGRQLLRNLSGYLRAAVGRSRGGETTLGEQVAMAESFLEIFRSRMGDRLRVSFDVPAQLHDALLPTLMLGTLVENAVKHGIGPRETGGSITISASAGEGHLVVEVADDGRGFHGEAGTGVGLANTRARLTSLYGDEGDLDLRANATGGVTAAIRLPLGFASEPGPAAEMAIASRLEANGPREPQGFWQRLGSRLTWKHWAWAVGVGVAFAALDRLRTFAVPFDNFADLWLHETYQDVAVASCFMLAIVVVESWRADSKAPSGWAYFAAWLAGAIACGAIAWSFPYDLGDASPLGPDGKAVNALIQKAREEGHDARVAEVFEAVRVMTQGALGVLLYVWLRNAKRAAEALSRAEIERAEAERKLLASRIEAVEAEVDPAFMFSTLDTIEEIYDRDRVAADAMLDELIAFLRAAIPRLRGHSQGEALPAQTATV